MGAQDSTLSTLCGNATRNDAALNTEVASESTAQYRKTSPSKNQKRYSLLEKELNSATKEMQHMKKLHDVMANQTNTKYSTLNEKYATEQAQKSKLLQQLQESSNKYQQYEKQLEKYKSRASDIQKQLINSLKLENELNQYKMSNLRLQQQMSDSNKYKSSVTNLKAENEKLLAIKLALETEVTKLNQMILELKNQFQKLFDENKIQHQQINELTKQTETNTATNMEIETLTDQNKILTQTIEELTQKLDDTQTERNDLQTEYDEFKQKAIVSHRESIINEQVIIAALRQQMVTLQSKLDTHEQIDAYSQQQQETDEDENNSIHIMPSVDILPSIEEKKEEQNSDSFDTEYDEEDDDINEDTIGLVDILKKEKDVTVSVQRVKHTLEKSITASDVTRLVMETYKTHEEDEIIDEIDEEQEDSDFEEESSLEEHEKLEIAKMKSIKKLQIGMDEEAAAMQKEMEQMQLQMQMSIKKEMGDMQSNLDVMRQIQGDEMKGDEDEDDGLESSVGGTGDDNDSADDDSDDNDSDDNNSDDNSQDTTREVSISISVSGNDGIEVGPDIITSPGPGNLFRYRSMVKWDQIDLDQQKKEMAQQMIHLVKRHAKKNASVKNVMKQNVEKKSDEQ